MTADLLTDAQILGLAPELGGQRVDRYSFNLLLPDRTPVGALQARKDVTPSLEVNTTRTSIRTCSSLVVVDPPDLADLAGLRLQPVLTLQNGSQKPLGVLMFGEDDRNPTSPHLPWMPQLFDEGFLLDQYLPQSWSVPTGASVLGAFTQLAGEILDPLGVPHSYDVDDVGADNPLLFPVGSLRSDALKSLATLLGVLPPYFDNFGVHTLQQPPTVEMLAEHTYGAGTGILKDSTTTKSSLYSAPNRYIVVGDNVGGAPIAGIYDLPPAAPHSAANNGGQIIPTSQAVPGVTDPMLAAQIAYVNALTDRNTYGTATFDTTAVWHDVFDTVNLLGITYLETGWTMQLGAGQGHSHQLTRMWS